MRVFHIIITGHGMMVRFLQALKSLAYDNSVAVLVSVKALYVGLVPSSSNLVDCKLKLVGIRTIKLFSELYWTRMVHSLCVINPCKEKHY